MTHPAPCLRCSAPAEQHLDPATHGAMAVCAGCGGRVSPERWTLIEADVVEALRAMPDCSFDGMLSDPPAGISFMGRAWDSDKGGRDKWIAWLAEAMREALRVLRPGAHILVWALPRTSHWTATAIEDAGFEIRDVITHHFASGFPKSLDASKAIDAAAGARRQPTGVEPRRPNPRAMNPGGDGQRTCDASTRYDVPATPAAARWSGYGTALKPASEHWILARKPLDGTVAHNALTHGVGGINVDGCRLGTVEDTGRKRGTFPHSDDAWGDGHLTHTEGSPLGRWPANLAFSHVGGPDGCRRVGTRRVKGAHHTGDISKVYADGPRSAYGSFAGHAPSTFVAHDGRETVEAWECVQPQTIYVERFTLPDGTSIDPATASVPLLLEALGALLRGLPSSSHTWDTESTRVSGRARAHRWSAPEGSPADCPDGRRSGGEPARPAAEGVQASARQLAGALESALVLGRSLVRSREHRSDDHPSSSGGVRANGRRPRKRDCNTEPSETPCQTAADETACGTADTEFSGPRRRASRCSSDGSSTSAARDDSAEATSARRPDTVGEIRRLAAIALRLSRSVGVTCDYRSIRLAGCPVAELDRQSGNRPGMSGGGAHRDGYGGGMFGGIDSTGTARGDEGGASRFFFCAKASRSEREFGCDHLPPRKGHEAVDREEGSAGLGPRAGAGRTADEVRNFGPCVKPIALTRWLATLVLPPPRADGQPRRILVPYAGTGSEMIGALRAGWDEVVGIQRIADDEERGYVAIARARLERWMQVRPDIDEAEAVRSADKPDAEARQVDMFGGSR